MSANLGTLTLDLIAKIGGFTGPIDKARKDVKKSLDKMGKDAEKYGKIFGAALGVGITTASAAFVKLTADGLRNVDAQGKLARSLDTSYDSVTALSMAFGDNGIDGYEASLNRLNRRLGAAQLGRGSALNTVKELNLDLNALSRLDADEKLAVIADRIKAVANNSQEAARFAQDLGFEQAAAAGFFLQGGDAIRAYREDVEALGLSLSDFEVSKIEDANNSMGIFGDIVQSIQQRLAVQAAPYLEYIGQEIEKNVKEMGGFDKAAEMVFDNIIKGAGFVADSVDGIRRVFIVAANGIVVAFAGALDGLSGAAATTLSIVNKIPTVRLLVDDEDIQALRDFQQLQRDVVNEGIGGIQDQLTGDLPSVRLNEFAAKMKAELEAARVEFEKNQETETKFRNNSIRLTNDQVKAQDEYLKKLQETQNVLNQSEQVGIDAQFEKYLNLAKSDIVSGSQFLGDRINSLKDLVAAQASSGINPDTIAIRQSIIAELEQGLLPAAKGKSDPDNPLSQVASLSERALAYAQQSVDLAKQVQANTLVVAEHYREKPEPIGELNIKIAGPDGQPGFEGSVTGDLATLERLKEYIDNFTNNQARAAAGG